VGEREREREGDGYWEWECQSQVKRERERNAFMTYITLRIGERKRGERSPRQREERGE
jgi:hypothetical protein